jgi:5-deoxy-D-glucuronate isomerase
LGGGYDNAVVKSLRLGSDLGHRGGGRERRDLKQVAVGGSAGAGVDEVVTAVPPGGGWCRWSPHRAATELKPRQGSLGLVEIA